MHDLQEALNELDNIWENKEPEYKTRTRAKDEEGNITLKIKDGTTKFTWGLFPTLKAVQYKNVTKIFLPASLKKIDLMNKAQHISRIPFGLVG